MSGRTKMVGKCTMFVIGMDMKCPLCHTLVRSGEQHSCVDGEYGLTIKLKDQKLTSQRLITTNRGTAAK